MQQTHTIDDKDYEYPENLKPVDVNVYVHPSNMLSTHDYSCSVCRTNHAVLSSGIMKPCWECQREGWQLSQKDNRPWWKRLFTKTNS